MEKSTSYKDGAAMYCAEITGPAQPLRMSTRRVPEAPEDGFLLRTQYAGICHSDVHFIDDNSELGEGKVFRYSEVLGEKFSGIVLGHEISGVIVALGSDVPEICPLRPGDLVTVYPFMGCQQCEQCLSAESQLCENNKSGTTDLGQGPSGGFSTHVPVSHWRFGLQVPTEMPLSVACTVPCSALTAYNALLSATSAIQNALAIRSSVRLLIIGTGALGMWCTILSKALFEEKHFSVICADTNPDKLKTARELGADDVIHWPADPDISKESLVSMTTQDGRQKMAAVIDFVGTPQTQLVAMDALYNGGAVVAVGLAGGQVDLPLPVIISRSLGIYGVRTGGLRHLKDLLELMSMKEITKHPPLEFCRLEKINGAIDRIRKGNIKGRAVVKFVA